LDFFLKNGSCFIDTSSVDYKLNSERNVAIRFTNEQVFGGQIFSVLDSILFQEAIVEAPLF
jgi:hypothetical protein